MLFNSFEFVFFFIFVYLIYCFCKNYKLQNHILLISSYIFYGSWNWKFLYLIFLSTVITYICGLGIFASQEKWKKNRFLWFSIISNLGILGVFKYFNFFTASFRDLLNLIGLKNIDALTLKVILPVGISFYTFLTLSYTIDVYRGKLKAESNFFTLALYISFFPQLLAGPIERATNLIPQFNRPRSIAYNDIKEGLWLVFLGFFLKVFVADNLSGLVNQIFTIEGTVSGGEALIAIYAFAFQILGDFAGYSSMAIGIAKLLGFDLMTNFLFPYFVTNPSDFWKHWHISLSTWLRDYLYIPLGGNRISTIVTYRNLFITMLLGGLWHGAAWTFIIWGAYQGSVLILDRLLKTKFPKLSLNTGSSKIVRIVQILLMFQVTCIGWLIFRAQNLAQVGNMIHSIVFNFTPVSSRFFYYFIQLLFFTWLLILIQFIQYKKNNLMAVVEAPNYMRFPIFLLMFYSIVIWGQFGSQQFIYFQF